MDPIYAYQDMTRWCLMSYHCYRILITAGQKTPYQCRFSLLLVIIGSDNRGHHQQFATRGEKLLWPPASGENIWKQLKKQNAIWLSHPAHQPLDQETTGRVAHVSVGAAALGPPPLRVRSASTLGSGKAAARVRVGILLRAGVGEGCL